MNATGGNEVADRLRHIAHEINAQADDARDMGGQGGVNPEVLDECIRELEAIRDAG